MHQLFGTADAGGFCEHTFRLIRQLPEMRLGVAALALVAAVRGSDTTPRQLHLAFADERTMAIGWLTSGGLSVGSRPLVRYGTQPGRWTESATGTTNHDSTATFLHHHHDVTLRDLRPNTTYYYIAGAESSTERSSERSFTTLALPSHDGAFKCSIFGDMGVNKSEPTIARLGQHPEHAFIVHVGDVSYADDLDGGRKYDGGRGYEKLYDRYGDMVEPLASSKAYFVTPGNHDVSCHILSDKDCIAAHRNFTPFNRRWRMPAAASGGSLGSNMWYSWRAQRTHFASISTETDYPGAPTTPSTRVAGGRGGGFGDQVAWLDADLRAAHEDPTVDWIVVVGHRPIYESIDDAKDWPVDTVKKCRAVSRPKADSFLLPISFHTTPPLYRVPAVAAATWGFRSFLSSFFLLLSSDWLTGWLAGWGA